MGDVFPDKIDLSFNSLQRTAKGKVNVPPARRFVGLDAYQKVIDSGIDVVLLTAPPGFRPQHLRAAVEAGKHIFSEKPMAVDAPGVRSVLATVAEAKKKELSLQSGFQWRTSAGHRETFRRIHEGAIGAVNSIYSDYNTGSINKHDKWNRQNTKGDLEWMLRRWYFFTWLSGDHLVEQAVHGIDKMLWAMNDEPPAKAIAHGGRQVRTDPEYGHIYDHFAVVYQWENGVRGYHFCRQQDRCASGTTDTYTGSKGVCNIISSRALYTFKGETNWRYDGPREDPKQIEHDEFFAAIRAGNPINVGDRMITSTMMAILGRMAAYTGQEITWDQAMNSKEDLGPEKLDWDTPIPVPPVAMPGKTKFI
jgi:predicted dehydrogenase